MNKSFSGVVLIVLAAIAWGLSGVSGQYLMKQGISVYLLTSLRLLLSGIVLIAFVLIKQPSSLSGLCPVKEY